MTVDERIAQLEANAPHLAAKLRNLDQRILATIFQETK